MKNLFLLFTLLCSVCFLGAQNSIPTTAIKNLDGKSLTLQDCIKPGKVTIISFWATWCSPCKKELDAVAESWESWKKSYNCDLFAITVDDRRTLGKVKPMVAEKGWTFEVYSDVNKDLLTALSGQSVPFTVVIDKAGNIAHIHNGYTPGDEVELEAKVKELAAK
ncbi:MAG TPA: TlpA disulfide reductase family protein [Saprospiraceae bacterium]|nr:TlpA disulfide reductase family protein [Saprospiraceae bacterium]